MVAIIWTGFIGLAVAGFVNFCFRLYQVRMHVRRVKTEHGVDILPHSFLFGHLLVIAGVLIKAKLPPKAHSHWLPLFFLEQYPELAGKGILYLDVWPISEPLLSVYNPEMMAQLTEGNFPKSPLMVTEMGPVTGGNDILTSEGQQWKRARSMFNPGFSAKNLTSLLPEFIEEIEAFRCKLQDAVHDGGIIKLEDWTTSLATDVIGRAILGVRLNTQVEPPPLIETLKAQIPLLYNQLDLYKILNPIRYIKLWIYRRRFRDLLIPYIRNTARNYDSFAGPKTVLKLALKERASEVKDFDAHMNDFIEDQVGQFWIMLFAGHDTTSTTMTYAFYLLSRHPDKAAKVRAEHDRVLGTNPAQAAQKFKLDPSLVNQLPYTAAVFKETLRLWPPVAGGVRSPSKGFFLTHPDTGERFPAWGFMVLAAANVTHRLPQYWPEATSFLPERWLVRDPTDPLYPRKDAYRPFEAGSRNCIGQELVSLEIRLVLAMTMREFDIEDTYPDDGVTFLGEKAYQVDLAESVVTAHIRDRMPVRVKAR